MKKVSLRRYSSKWDRERLARLPWPPMIQSVGDEPAYLQDTLRQWSCTLFDFGFFEKRTQSIWAISASTRLRGRVVVVSWATGFWVTSRGRATWASRHHLKAFSSNSVFNVLRFGAMRLINSARLPQRLGFQPRLPCVPKQSHPLTGIRWCLRSADPAMCRWVRKVAVAHLYTYEMSCQ